MVSLINNKIMEQIMSKITFNRTQVIIDYETLYEDTFGSITDKDNHLEEITNLLHGIESYDDVYNAEDPADGSEPKISLGQRNALIAALNRTATEKDEEDQSQGRLTNTLVKQVKVLVSVCEDRIASLNDDEETNGDDLKDQIAHFTSIQSNAQNALKEITFKKTFQYDGLGSTLVFAESLGFVDNSPSSNEEGWNSDEADGLEDSAIEFIESKGYKIVGYQGKLRRLKEEEDYESAKFWGELEEDQS